MLKKNTLIAKISILVTVLLIAVSSNAFGGDFSAFEQIWSIESNPIWSNYLADTLSKDESKTVTVRANEPYNYTNIKLIKGRRYKFTVASPGWNNGMKETDAGGYNSDAPYSNTRRHTEYRMMELVGEIFSQNKNPLAWTGKKFRIGLGRDTYTAAEDGYLITFANDCLPCYADNSRVVTLTVKRIE